MRFRLALALIAVAGCGSHGPATDGGAPDLALPPPLPAARPIGLDMPDLLRTYLGLASGDADAARHQIDLARARGFTHARLEGAQFWPSELDHDKGWRINPTAYFQAFDALVADARARGLQLVPSLLWNSFMFADAAGEPRGRLFVPGSASRMLAERYITEVVTRYKDNDTILFWEIGNELNLDADLDYSNCAGASPPSSCYLAPTLGTPLTRTSADNFYSCNACRAVSTTQQDLGQFVAAIAQLIHGIDPTRSISSGYANLRPNAYHAAYTPCPACDYTADTPAQLETMLQMLHPDGVDILSAHHYPGSTAMRFGDTDPTGATLIARMQAAATRLGKQLYIGEWGELSPGAITCNQQKDSCGGDANKSFSLGVLDALVANEVPWSGLWAYEDYPNSSCAGVATCYTVVDGDALVQSMVAHAEAYGSCAGKPDGAACPLGTCAAQRCRSSTQPPAPTTLATYTFRAAIDTSGWIVFTNCTGCTAGGFAVVGSGAGAYAQLTSNDLPCSGACSYPGSYAISPSLPVAGGTAIVRFSARASVPSGALISIILADGAGKQNGQTDIAVEMGTSFRVNGGTLQLPAGTAKLSVRVALLKPNATLDLDSITIFTQP